MHIQQAVKQHVAQIPEAELAERQTTAQNLEATLLTSIDEIGNKMANIVGTPQDETEPKIANAIFFMLKHTPAKLRRNEASLIALHPLRVTSLNIDVQHKLGILNEQSIVDQAVVAILHDVIEEVIPTDADKGITHDEARRKVIAEIEKNLKGCKLDVLDIVTKKIDEFTHAEEEDEVFYDRITAALSENNAGQHLAAFTLKSADWKDNLSDFYLKTETKKKHKIEVFNNYFAKWARAVATHYPNLDIDGVLEDIRQMLKNGCSEQEWARFNAAES